MPPEDTCEVWCRRMKDSIEDEDFFDAYFKAKDVFGTFSKIRCNRVILSLASPVFKKQFFGSLRVKDGETVDIVDGTAEAFKDLIDFIYCEKSFKKYEQVNTNTFKTMLDFCHFGHKYEIPSLVNFTSNVINSKLTINKENAVAILQDLEPYKLNLESEYHVISNKCFCFLDDKFEDIFFSKDFLKPPEVNDANFLSFQILHTLLKRPSLKTSEYNIYKLLKEYFLGLVGDDQHLFSEDGGNCILEIFTELVDYSKMSLAQIKQIGEEKWLPNDYLLDLAISAMNLNLTSLKPSVDRSKQSMIQFTVVKDPIHNGTHYGTVETIFKLNKRAIFELNRIQLEKITITQGVRTKIGSKHCFYVEPEIAVSLTVMGNNYWLKSNPEQRKMEKNGMEIEFLSNYFPSDMGNRFCFNFYPVGEDISKQSLQEIQAFFESFSQKNDPEGAVCRDPWGKLIKKEDEKGCPTNPDSGPPIAIAIAELFAIESD
eukprot:GFUD01009218.1.p1 GENE.GFUD01009218.1~~GFUD01009218.1.p1  ORF type:complete len:485 (+),score=120.45 GFUD01009218.1:33-1487(+)